MDLSPPVGARRERSGDVVEGPPVRDLRRTVLHGLTETACHAGHQRLVLT